MRQHGVKLLGVPAHCRRLCLLGATVAAFCAAASWSFIWHYSSDMRASRRPDVSSRGSRTIAVGCPGIRLRSRSDGCNRPSLVRRHAASKGKALGDVISDGDEVYIKTWTGRYIGEIDGTTKKEWVKARGKKKDRDHCLIIEKFEGGEVRSGDIIYIVMPNGAHMDVMGSAVRARYYDPRGEWQKLQIIKQQGGVIRNGDKIFLRSVYKNGRDYLDAQPLEKAPDGEVKCRWPDEGDWQIMTIEK